MVLNLAIATALIFAGVYGKKLLVDDIMFPKSLEKGSLPGNCLPDEALHRCNFLP